MPDALPPLPEVDLDAITDPAVRAVVARVLNFAEEAVAAVGVLEKEIQRLRDENLRLKGEHGSRPRGGGRGGTAAGQAASEKPSGHTGETSGGGGYSSEEARHEGRIGRGKGARRRRSDLPVDRVKKVRLSRADLPPDVVSKGFERHVVQGIVFERRNTVFLLEKLHSPSQQKTYMAALPEDCRGGVTGGLRAFVLELAYGANVSFPQILELLTRQDIRLAKGTLSNILTRGLEDLHREAQEVLEAGLRAAPWHQLDVTATPVGKDWHACHTLGNPSYRFFRTDPSQSRVAILATLRGGRPERFRLDEAAFTRLAAAGVGARTLATLRRLTGGPEWDADTFGAQLAARLPRLGKKSRSTILEAAAISAYRAATDWPVVECLLGDDAAQFRELTEERALCWVHDARFYQKLDPGFRCFRSEVRRFQKKYWAYYRKLLAYRKAPTPAWAAELEADFDQLFGEVATYAGLDRCIERTRGNKARLLMVLKHPELPLHNNDSELAARRRVMKRRVSHGPKSSEGAQAWDTFHTLAATAAKLGVSFSHLLRDRLKRTNRIPWLPHLVTQRAMHLNLGWSWETT